MGIQETFMEDDTKWTGDEYTWFFSSSIPTEDKEYRKKTTCGQRKRDAMEHRGFENHGVAVMIRNKILKSVQDIKPLGSRLMEVWINGTIPLQIIKAYSTTAVATDDEKDTFYENLQNNMSGNGFSDTIILGDMNTKLLHQKEGEENIMGQ